MSYFLNDKKRDLFLLIRNILLSELENGRVSSVRYSAISLQKDNHKRIILSLLSDISKGEFWRVPFFFLFIYVKRVCMNIYINLTSLEQQRCSMQQSNVNVDIYKEARMERISILKNNRCKKYKTATSDQEVGQSSSSA